MYYVIHIINMVQMGNVVQCTHTVQYLPLPLLGAPFFGHDSLNCGQRRMTPCLIEGTISLPFSFLIDGLASLVTATSTDIAAHRFPSSQALNQNSFKYSQPSGFPSFETSSLHQRPTL